MIDYHSSNISSMAIEKIQKKGYLSINPSLVALISLALVACGGGGSTATPPTTYTVAGTTAGLATGMQVTLSNNGVDALTVKANGVFAFAAPVLVNGSYAATVTAQPTGQTCSIANSQGASITASVSNIHVTCSANAYTIAGTVSGLIAGQQVTLSNNGADALAVSANGGFSFTNPVAYNGSYAVTVGTQPIGQTCTVTAGSGTGVTVNISAVQVICSASTHTIAGTVSGLIAGQQVTLSNNGADALAVSANGGFSFTTPVAYNGSYAVTVRTQPIGQTCTVTAGSGTGVTADISAVQIICSASTYTIAGTVSGVASGKQVTLNNNASDAMTISANGGFTFTTPVAYNGSYAVTVGTQPIGQTCTVTAGSGTGVTTNISNVSVSCRLSEYAYVPRSGSQVASRLVQYVVDAGGALIPVSTPIVVLPQGIGAVTADPTGRYLYVLGGRITANGYGLSQFTIGSGGILTPMSIAIVQTGRYPNAIAVDPTGKYVYVASGNNSFDGGLTPNIISQYAISTSGALVPMNKPSVAIGKTPKSVAIDPTGKYLYVVNYDGGTASQFTIGADGALTPMRVATVATGTAPQSITVDPTGKYVYIANYEDSTISQFSIGVGGSLASMSTATIATGSKPYSVTVDPMGKYVYVANYVDQTLSQFTIGVGGALVPMITATVATGPYPKSVSVDPAGNFVYVVNADGTISQFTIGADGALTPMSDAVVGVGFLACCFSMALTTGH